MQVLAWVDSDSLVVSSLQPLLAQADRLEDPGSARPGPRIGASYAGEWWDVVIYRGRYQHWDLSRMLSILGSSLSSLVCILY